MSVRDQFKIMLSTSENIPTDKRAAQFQERFVNISATIAANGVVA
ncbi:MAG: hypothetical protein VB140_03645 [Burkholderia sp.]